MISKITNEFIDALGQIISWIPEIIAFIVIIIIGYLFAKLVQYAIIGILRGLNLNKLISKAPFGETVERISKNPSRWIGNLGYWIVFLFGISLAVLALDAHVLSQAIYDIYGYIPNILSALLILIVAIVLSGWIYSLVKKLMDGTVSGKIVGAIAPALILTISVFMILVQLKIATSIVIITYIALLGSLAVAFAIAFGWGGIDTARKLLDMAYKKGEENAGQIKEDFQRGSERAKEETERTKDKYSRE